ncbi:MAG: NDP-hexose 4-ketoreductase, partial [Planctomycetota bacterium]|nr:NDP-hexose 4-ketoreductase [Planctomycetota bacterium]
MTTNVGAHAIKNESRFGFEVPGDDSSFESMKERVFDEINKAFRPEFLNRMEEPIIFRHLEKQDLQEVVDLELNKVCGRLHEKGFEVTLSNEAKEFLIKKGTNLDFGARPMRRALESFVEDPLSEELLQGAFEGKNKILIDVVLKDGKAKHLKFDGVFESNPEEEEEPVAAAVGDGDEPANETTTEPEDD